MVSGLLEPGESFFPVKLNPAAGQVTESQAVFGLGKTPIGGFPNPLDPFGGILGDAESVEVTDAEREFRLGMPLFSGGFVPLIRAAGILVHPTAAGVAFPELILRFGISLIDRFPEPACSFGGVLFDFCLSDEVEVRQLALRLGQPLFGGGAEPPRSEERRVGKECRL